MYHGVLDITLNKVIFNTNENIDIFIPYSSNSMLAITKESAYRICLIKDSNGNCIDECSQSDNIIHDVEGNKCGISCDAGKYLIIPEAVCSSECNNNIFVLYEHNCGLCRDLDSTHKYKLINGTECLNEIIEGSEIYNSKLNLLVCKSGYILNDNKCIPHCYERCKLCYEFSMDTLNQKCIECKEGFSLENGNCNIIITTIITTVFTTIPSAIPTTILTTILTTIPTTIPTTMLTTIFTIIPTTNHYF